MASKDELRDQIAKARKAEHAADKALGKLADLTVPGPAHRAKLALTRKLRAIRDRMADRIPALRKRLEAKRKDGAEKAADWFANQIGKTESNYSNTGPYPISECQVFTIGYDGVPYCGCCCCYAAVHEGGANIPNKARLAYVPYIVSDANAGVNGLTKVSTSDVRRGDLIAFNFDGGVADHVGMAAGPIVNGMTDCYEANTSSGTSGSQSNGGGIYRRQRPVSQVAVVARPDYS